LEILGLSWGKNRDTPNHVLRCQRWWQCRLPRSVNTIADDIKLDVPIDRLAGYAAFLQIPIEILQDEGLTETSEPYTTAIYRAREVTDALNLPLFAAFNNIFCKQFYINNPQSYIDSLFELVRGIYTVYAIPSASGTIARGCLMVHGCQNHLLRASAFMVLQDTEIHYDVIIYRWGNNLHVSYYSQDMFIFGRLLAVDPLRHFAISQRRPFALNLAGVADAIDGPDTIDILHVRVERVEQPKEAALWDRWTATCREVEKRPHILPADPEYGRLVALIRPSRQGAASANVKPSK
jgi:hypothetical protein